MRQRQHTHRSACFIGCSFPPLTALLCDWTGHSNAKHIQHSVWVWYISKYRSHLVPFSFLFWYFRKIEECAKHVSADERLPSVVRTNATLTKRATMHALWESPLLIQTQPSLLVISFKVVSLFKCSKLSHHIKTYVLHMAHYSGLLVVSRSNSWIYTVPVEIKRAVWFSLTGGCSLTG